jgi:small subunit ribosomal protein S16
VAVKIKLKRLGRTRVPTYRIVVADARTKRDGRAIEEIGKYHPKEEPSLIEVDSERAQHWLSVGAQPTEPVLTILKITGDWQKFKGEPGAEGTLRTAEPRGNRKERFAEALKDAAKDDTESSRSSGSRAGGRPKKPDQARGEGKADSAKARSKGSDAQPAGGAGDERAAAASDATSASDAGDAAPAAAAAGESGSSEQGSGA